MNETDELEEIITTITAKANEHAMIFFEKIMAKGDENRRKHNEHKETNQN
nr:MAG TPA: hypothetical protein [Caudoviricetes sp.]